MVMLMGRCVVFVFAVLCQDAVCDTTVAGGLLRMLFHVYLLKKRLKKKIKR